MCPYGDLCGVFLQKIGDEPWTALLATQQLSPIHQTTNFVS